MSRDPSTLGAPAHERRPLDLYPTPACLIEAMVSRMPDRGPIWEPAAGDGRLARALEVRGNVIATDIADGGLDFLTCGAPSWTNWLLPTPRVMLPYAIVTNPPFKLLTEFIQRGLWHLDQGHAQELILLARENHDTAACRADLFARAHTRLVCCWRPRWIECTTTSPRWSFVWWRWKADYGGPPRCIYAMRPPAQ